MDGTTAAIDHGGKETSRYTLEEHIKKAEWFMNQYYEGWRQGKQSTPLIPAVCYQSTGHYEPQDSEVSGYVQPTAKEAGEIKGQIFEEQRWYTLLKEAALAMQQEQSVFPFLALYDASYSQFEGSEVPVELQLHLSAFMAQHFKKKAKADPNSTSPTPAANTAQAQSADADTESNPPSRKMVDFILFFRAANSSDAHKLVLIECKSGKFNKNSVSGQIKRCAEFIGLLADHVSTHDETQTEGGDFQEQVFRLYFLVAADRDDRQLPKGQYETLDGDLFHFLGSKYFDVDGNPKSSEFLSWLDNLFSDSCTPSVRLRSINALDRLISLIVAQQNVVTANVYEQIVKRICTQEFYERACSRPESNIVRSAGIAAFQAITSTHAPALASRLFYLSPKQAEVIRDETCFCSLQGPPGTGKTVLLQFKAVQWYAEGWDVVCAVGTDGMRQLYVDYLTTIGFVKQRQPKHKEYLCQYSRAGPGTAITNAITIVTYTVNDGSWTINEFLTSLHTEQSATFQIGIIVDDCPWFSKEQFLLQLTRTPHVSAAWICDRLNNMVSSPYTQSIAEVFKPHVLADVFRYTRRIFEYLKLNEQNFKSARCSHCLMGYSPTLDEIQLPVEMQHYEGADFRKRELICEMQKKAVRQSTQLITLLKSRLVECRESVCKLHDSASFLYGANDYDFTKMAVLVEAKLQPLRQWGGGPGKAPYRLGTFGGTLPGILSEIIRDAANQIGIPTKRTGSPGNAVVVGTDDDPLSLEFTAVIALDVLGDIDPWRKDGPIYLGLKLARSRSIAKLCHIRINFSYLPGDDGSLS